MVAAVCKAIKDNDIISGSDVDAVIAKYDSTVITKADDIVADAGGDGMIDRAVNTEIDIAVVG